MQHVSLETRRPQRHLLLGGGALGVPHGVENAHWVDLNLYKWGQCDEAMSRVNEVRVCKCMYNV